MCLVCVLYSQFRVRLPHYTSRMDIFCIPRKHIKFLMDDFSSYNLQYEYAKEDSCCYHMKIERLTTSLILENTFI